MTVNRLLGHVIEITHKPRLRKQGGEWQCMGLRNRWLGGTMPVVVSGETPRGAYEEWKRVRDQWLWRGSFCGARR